MTKKCKAQNTKTSRSAAERHS